MGRSVEKEGFKLEITQKGLKIGSLEFSPAEAARAKSCLSWASRLSEAKVLPPSVGHDPFVVKFGSDGVHVLDRSDKPSGGFKFKFNQLDTLIELIDSGVSVHTTGLEIQKMDQLRRGPRGGNGNVHGPDIFDGHN